MATTPTSVRRVRAPVRAGGRLADDADAPRLTWPRRPVDVLRHRLPAGGLPLRLSSTCRCQIRLSGTPNGSPRTAAGRDRQRYR